MLEISLSLIAAFLIGGGITLVCVGGRKKTNSYGNKPMMIAGWIIIGVTIVASFVGLAIDFAFGELSFGTFLLVTTMPTILIVGFVLAIGFGIACLVKGYEKNEDGARKTSQIITGWALLILAIVLVLAVIITLSLVFNQQSGHSEPVRFM